MRYPDKRWQIGLAAIGVAVVAVVIGRWLASGPRYEPMPDFSAIASTSERKQAFFNFLYPHVREANESIAKERTRLQGLRDRLANGGRLSARDLRWLESVVGEYGVDAELDPAAQVAALGLRLDEIPAGLAMAQAALESGWGTSRFARQGNNLFGVWCYEPGCGIVPARRPAGATYEVKKYRSTTDSLADYMRNLNTNDAYRWLRTQRARMREQGEPLSALTLAGGLTRYSQEGQVYIDKVRAVIRGNDLETMFQP
jgi:Bax protein